MEIAGILVALVAACAALAVAISARAKTRGIARFLTHDGARRHPALLLTGQRTAFERGVVVLTSTVPLGKPDGLSALSAPNQSSTDTLAVARTNAERQRAVAPTANPPPAPAP
jgi:hypothetical protein